MPPQWKILFSTLSTASLLLLLSLLKLSDNRLHLVFCNVGQGDGILIYQKTTQVIVDGGPDNSILSCLGRHMPFWDRKIEYVILTNSDLDHYGGLIEVVKRYKVEGFGTSGVQKEDIEFQTLVKELADRKIPVTNLSEKTDLRAGSMAFDTVWPKETSVLGASTFLKGQAVNENSLVFTLSYGSFDALLTGDIIPPGTDEAVSLARIHLASLEILKVPHHGSKNGLTKNMVESARPGLAVVSVGKNNRYGHPHQETLDLLKGLKTLRTDLNGEIEITTNGKDWSYKTQN
ncbi:MAG: hypothetical protein A2700_02005 [Candidatus Blackburnbacteria bacterium RIFCSPHIGHO2_01_FULL_44_64]|uniref:Metallo-beta-lactamase domain-containing protein n=1 Tax=Candidatus Blackburnbacteria bacterium RIFCSPHIGHO2_02_FULL_44_20 TaxID=1797516 RepID=A0A1G1VAD9_9BACT|nr:MAG: hypothetical protein A2700_02005 [Candidatus Blackburnbacteria bacterium RIFCSPHIGHO2_01_FULL_44_64]OGY10479.1 MAG: hypothetical protein A3E16_04280 [Candidatus Blackburnbacteria bacterium RIFCSPHIGHO2_12_FULL_44_25]OGY12237.1 MAG: hypothetical protein A3D26_02190 [Candidatus Blackburnbacteria bacterium RIFCSPHIGHO2_02_FULL_44_20]OGY15112.1 MAG: hypothetical protein A3A62_00205 [Candidatus Blackburnbacteria bacterium RIFCSPLOWO2_01_FULL_44_43]OGY15230.1 MAG: hypothetical protein A3H88_0